MTNGARYSLEMNRFFASIDQMEVEEYGESPEKATPPFVLKFGGRSVMVWAGITEAPTELVFAENGSLILHSYITEVLEDHVMPFMVSMGDQGIFMHNYARPHAARIVS